MLTTISKPGPKTAAGKKRSAQNAIKSGLYTAQLIAGESTSSYVAVRSALIEDFQAYDALALSAVEELAITVLRKNRLFTVERQYMSGIMQTEDARKAVARQLYGNESYARVVPWWFLETGESDEKRKAMQIFAALNQLDELKAIGVKQGIQVLKDKYPEAYWLVMGYQQLDGEHFWQVIARVTQRSHLIDGVDVFKAKVKADFERHIDWAQNHRRYQSVVNLVYAEFKMQMMAKPEMIKLINSLNRQTEHALSVLHARDKMLVDVNDASTITGSDGCGVGTVAVTQSAEQAKTDVQPSNVEGPSSERAAQSSPSTAQLGSAVSHDEAEATVSTQTLRPDKPSGALTLEAGQDAHHTNEIGETNQDSPSSQSKP